MCGIAGCVVAPGQKPPKEALTAMATALTHRGPDDRGIVVSRNVGLVNTRLAIVDPSPAGHQPMTSPDCRWLLTYNGEIFNHREIRSELRSEDWRGDSDTESLLAALDAWDTAALDRCNGFFAFAAFDTTRRRLLLARDRFGVKPLYTAWWDGGLWFASEMRALLAAGVPARARADVLGHAATTGWGAGRQTPIEGIERLPPGAVISVATDSLDASERIWFEPGDAVDAGLAEELAGRSRAELADRLESVLRGAVRRRLLGSAAIGSACSGGLDSTLVTALARDEIPDFIAFNASLVDESRADEGPWAALAARELGVELDAVRVTASDWRAGLVGAVMHHERPLSLSGSSVPLRLIARRAHERGVKVVLAGEASDELFGGYPIHYGPQYRRFLTAPQMLRRLVEEARGPHGITWIRRALLARLSGRPVTPEVISLPTEILRERQVTRRKAQRAYAHHPGPRGQLEAELLNGLSSGSFPFLLNRMDKDLMAHSVETRLPFLDLEVVRLVVNLPLEHRVAPATKGILRDVARRWIPESIVRRPKQQGLQFDATHRIEEAARPEFLEQGYLRDLIPLPAAGWRGLLDKTTQRTRLWTAEIWCRLFIEKQDVASVERDLWVSETA